MSPCVTECVRVYRVHFSWTNIIYILILDGCVEIASYILCMVLMNRIGRSYVLSGSTFIAAIGLLISLIIVEFANNDPGLINSICCL